MAKFVWCTRGSSEREMRAALAVPVEADSLEEARAKVVSHMRSVGTDPQCLEDFEEEYGDSWFVQRLAEDGL